MVDMTSSLRGQIWWSGGAVCPDALGGSENTLYYSCPGLCVCVCVCVHGGLGCDWLSARHDVSQLLIREAMKSPLL